MREKIPAMLYIVRSKDKPQIAILCTEHHLAKWVNKILKKGERPEVEPITHDQLIQIMKPDHNLN